MITGEKKSFPGKVSVHLDIEYHVASNLLVSGEDLTIPHILHRLRDFLKFNPHISHLLLNIEFPKVITCGLINIQGFFDHIRNSDSKIVAFLPIFLLEFVNDLISLTQYILNPPLGCRLFSKLVSHCIFREIQRIGMIQINQGHPFAGSYLPLYLQSLTSRCLLCVHIA